MERKKKDLTLSTKSEVNSINQIKVNIYAVETEISLYMFTEVSKSDDGF